MEFIRLFLFFGLVFHKLVWELLKKKNKSVKTQIPSTKKPFKRFVKFVKVLVLVFLIIQTLFLELFPISDQNIHLVILGIVFYLMGLATAVLGRIQLGKNWFDIEDTRVAPEQLLVNYGIYRFIRHPIYTGDILLLIGLELALNSWLVLGIFLIIPFVIRQALVEEALLAEKLPGYNEYRSKVKRFVPFVL